MSHVLVTTPLPGDALGPLTEAGHSVAVVAGGGRGAGPAATGSAGSGSDAALAERVAGADALVTVLTDRVDRAVLAAGGGRLAVVANVAAGHDNIDLAAAAELGVTVCTTPGILDGSTAEVAFALALMARRRTTGAEAALRGGRWEGWALDGFLGHDLHGATMGIVGWGRIGRAVARRAEAFGMRVVHTSRRRTDDPAGGLPLDDLLATADVVSLHLPLTEATRGLIGAAQLRRMKPTAVLVNTARGAIVDEAALAEALHAGTIFGAGLDVYRDEPRVHGPLLTAPGAVLLPHIGSATVRTREAMARAAVRNVIDALAGRPPSGAVPLPTVPTRVPGSPS